MALSKKQLEKLSGFTISLLSFGMTTLIGMVFLTDWKPVVTYIPYYNTKFEEVKKKEC